MYCAAIHLHPTAVDWSDRIVTNGGSRISDLTVHAASEWCVNVQNSAALSFSVLGSVLMFPPDSLTACLTPIVATVGDDPYTNHNFVEGDLSINGLTSDGTNQYLDTGCVSNDMPSAVKGGHSVYTYDNATQLVTTTGCRDGSNDFSLSVSFGGVPGGTGDCYHDCWNVSTGRVGTAGNNSNWEGYCCGSRFASNVHCIFKANSTTPHTTIQCNSTSGGSRANQNVYLYSWNLNGTPTGFHTGTISFYTIDLGITGTMSSQLFNTIQRFRQQIGGGWT